MPYREMSHKSSTAYPVGPRPLSQRLECKMPPTRGDNLGGFEANDSNTWEMVERFNAVLTRAARVPSLHAPNSLVLVDPYMGWPSQEGE